MMNNFNMMGNPPQKPMEMADKNIYEQQYKLQQSVSRQNEYEKGTRQQRDKIFKEIITDLRSIMVNKYDNYIVQKIFESGEEQHKLTIFDMIKDEFEYYYTEKYSSRVLQKVVEAFADKSAFLQQFAFLEEKVFLFFDDLILNENGNFVIQKCLELYQEEDFDRILLKLKPKIQSLCSHKYGCLLIQKIIDISQVKSVSQTGMLNQIIESILDQSVQFSKKEYSNYIIQHILEKGSKHLKDYILNKTVINNFILMSCNQFASNVVEKSIKISPDDYKLKIWKNITKYSAPFIP